VKFCSTLVFSSLHGFQFLGPFILHKSPVTTLEARSCFNCVHFYE